MIRDFRYGPRLAATSLSAFAVVGCSVLPGVDAGMRSALPQGASGAATYAGPKYDVTVNFSRNTQEGGGLVDSGAQGPLAPACVSTFCSGWRDSSNPLHRARLTAGADPYFELAAPQFRGLAPRWLSLAHFQKRLDSKK